jgi:hypothetical protein
LSGAGAELKEYAVGTEVLGRNSDFDLRLEPVVRVEARRLRAKLQEYTEVPDLSFAKNAAYAVQLEFRRE